MVPPARDDEHGSAQHSRSAAGATTILARHRDRRLQRVVGPRHYSSWRSLSEYSCQSPRQDVKPLDIVFVSHTPEVFKIEWYIIHVLREQNESLSKHVSDAEFVVDVRISPGQLCNDYARLADALPDIFHDLTTE
jgi:hypothetical protein